LIDDDILFKKDGWANEYVNAMRLIGVEQICLNDFKYINTVPTSVNINGILFNYHDHTTGCFIAISKKCLNVIGGFFNFKGKWGGEHENYYLRAQAAGLHMKHYFLDISNSSEYIVLNNQPSCYTYEEKVKMSEMNCNYKNGSIEIFQEIIE
jgi:hypothetical protein